MVEGAGVQLYRTFVVFLETENAELHASFAVTVYASTAVIVTITGAAQGDSGCVQHVASRWRGRGWYSFPRNGRYGTPEFCWLNDKDGTIWGFAAPAIAVLSINFALFFFILRAILDTGLPDDQQRIAETKRGLV